MRRKFTVACTTIEYMMDIKPQVKISTHKNIRVSLREMNTRVLYFFCKFAIICKSHNIYNIYK